MNQRHAGDVIHVACAADERYAPHSAAMLHSVLAYSGLGRVHVHYLHGAELGAGTRGLLAGMIEGNGGSVSFLEIPEARVRDLPTISYLSSAMWYRIFLPELVSGVDRILYLDVDTIAVDTLEPLWAIDLQDNYIGAVTNVFEPQYRARPTALGLSGPEVYFNTGVVLMNVDLMRRDDCLAELQAYATAQAERLLWPDQDTLNVVLGHRRLALHPRWNCMNSVMHFPWAADVFGDDVLAEARQHPALRHFEGPATNKPWHYLCQRSMRRVYLKHRRKTPWPRVKLEGATLRNRMRRLGRAMRVADE